MIGIPYGEIDTVFLDAGNTIVSMDFDFILGELARRGMRVEIEVLKRAEAASRPLVSAELRRRARKESGDMFTFYVGAIFENLPEQIRAGVGRTAALIPDIAATLKMPRERHLWSSVMPGVPEALGIMRNLGLKMAVVSNADGFVEKLMRDAGLRECFVTVSDSALIGIEKPDPGIFKHTLNICGAVPERTLHVGDVYDVDVVGARAAGIHALLLDPYGDWRDADCERMPDLMAVARKFQAAKGRSNRS